MWTCMSIQNNNNNNNNNNKIVWIRIQEVFWNKAFCFWCLFEKKATTMTNIQAKKGQQFLKMQALQT